MTARCSRRTREDRNRPTRQLSTRMAAFHCLAACFILQLAFTTTACARLLPTASLNGRLVFEDQFTTGGLNLGKWQTSFRWGRTNPPEVQYYAADSFEFPGGVLRIKAEKRVLEGQTFTSGLIASWDRFAFTYGFVEIRARIPAGQGLWPAFWLLADSDTSFAEVDVLELIGQQPNTVVMSLHYNTAPGTSQSISSSYYGEDFSKEYHTFAVNWISEAVVWYVDGVERFRLTEHVPNEPMYIIANLAVGGEWPGSPDESTPFPAFFDIDYIRVFQR